MKSTDIERLNKLIKQTEDKFEIALTHNAGQVELTDLKSTRDFFIEKRSILMEARQMKLKE